jgi:GMP synthase-like glutamine amidotransferase
MGKQQIKIATIDLYNNERNEGMRCIKEIVSEAGINFSDVELTYRVYETRFKGDVPGGDYDIYISSGGPGSPFEGEGTQWEKDYFNLIDKIYNLNQGKTEKKKYLFFICHSFQMMARYFEFGTVSKRNMKSFGVMPFGKTVEGDDDTILAALSNPFYAADIRQYQVTEPNNKKIEELGANILSFEIVDDENSTEPALAAVRISDEIVGTQFHPEADPESMLYHFKQPERKQQVVERYDEKHYYEMMDLLKRPDTIKLTRKTVIPNFLNTAIEELSKILVEDK